MSKVNTVLGPIPAEELGIRRRPRAHRLRHARLRAGHQVVEDARAALRGDRAEAPRRSTEYGGGTFVDATGICNGRDVDYYKSLSAKTGVHIVACTGFVGGDTALPHFARASVDYLTRQFVHEITVGIGDTGSRAGVIKVGVSRGGRMTDLDKRIYRAAARAAVDHRRADPDPPGHRRRDRDRHLPRGGPPAGPRAVRARRRRRQRRARRATPGSPSRAAASASTPSATTPSSRTRRSGPARARSGWTTSSASSSRGYLDKRARLGRRQLQPAGLAGREGPHRQLHLRGPHPGPARRRHRRRHDHDASSSTTPPTS